MRTMDREPYRFGDVVFIEGDYPQPRVRLMVIKDEGDYRFRAMAFGHAGYDLGYISQWSGPYWIKVEDDE